MVKKKNRKEREQRVAEEVARGGSSEGVIQSGKIPKSETSGKTEVKNPKEAKWTPLRKECVMAGKHAGQK